MSVPDPKSDAASPVIEVFALGDYQTNCSIVHAPDAAPGDPCWVCDCGERPAALLDRLAQTGLVPEAFVLTHAHLDHIAGLLEARAKYPSTPIWIHTDEELWLTDPERNLSAFGPKGPVTAPPPDRLLTHGETLTLAGEPWRVLHVPGHSPGSCAFVHDASRTCLGGDALFHGSIGRTDFPGCSFETLADSIRTHLYALPEQTRVIPGHGPETTIGFEKTSNPFVKPL